MRGFVVTAVAALLAAGAAGCNAQIGEPLAASVDGGSSAADNPEPEPGPDAAPAPEEPADAATPIDLSHSTSDELQLLNSVSCNNGEPEYYHTDNSYYRVFKLAEMGVPGALAVSEVTIGVERAESAQGSQPLSLRLHTLDGTMGSGSLTEIASADIELVDQQQTLLPVPLSATVPAGAELVVEVHSPSGQGAGNVFFMGSNSLGEGAPGYMKAADCGINAPTRTAEIAADLQMHMVVHVTGTPL